MKIMERYPLVEQLDISLGAEQCFELFKERPHCFFLDSGMDPVRLGRYSFMGSEPFLILKSRGDEVTLEYTGETTETMKGNPFDVAGKLLETYRLEYDKKEVPFISGVVGYLGYDLCHFIEKLPKTTVDDLKLPECYLAFYDAVVAFDNLKDKVYLVSSGFPELEERARIKRASERLERLKELVKKGQSEVKTDNILPRQSITLKSNFSRSGYLKAVERAREYILAGDIFQVNLSQRFEAELPVTPYEFYRKLRRVNPAPFAAYLSFGDAIIASSSPERFLEVTGNRVQTRPVKGTRRRGETRAKDEALAAELIASPKDRAENIMIVDLERNDLGRVCRYGSVKVTELAALEKYASVFHLTSTVEGELRAGEDCISLLKATFPGGSITGAPKVRAMEIIDELEPTKRSVYTGAIGYLGFDGDMDLSIVIRTCIIKDGRIYFQVGGGIVYDSQPQAEYQETLDKAKSLVEALRLAANVNLEVNP